MKRVAVIYGGWSSEREVSISSGTQMLRAAEAAGYDAVGIDAGRNLAAQLTEAKPDVVLNGLHGPWGEDGCVQGLLEIMDLPYSHSGVLASALAMDKLKSKAVYRSAGLPVAEDKQVTRAEAAAAHALDPPYVIKPVNEGSSFGVLIVREGTNGPPQDLLDESWHYGDYLMAEEFIPGRELTVAVLGDRPLAVTEITTLRDYYDFDAKYSAGGSRHVIPADVPEHITAMAMDFAVRAHQVLGCRGATRSDFRYDDKRDRLVILETNTQPGMTPTSLVPEQAAFAGMSFEELVAWMIEDASCRR
ncbi:MULTISPECIES: D-alanine--D-alanine ligase [Hyphomonas]|uniref:D-alanine--D-alanine ligase n=1 Tax=Hyphomonas adhaerens TaxID=81029 RepID=A0A3B9H0W1_9PROT|nr:MULTISPECIES: D-alanine--D-alanine ligase [Hyphomonas]MBB41132.1 D-alanine--D-alanine ligase [Hyphomonas sp.]HAE28086.1 D-alanine--D-alanine ligase [Hyphomonas adhaerens]|tara:strand:+ start:16850 stop:17758 length:909 start_codon:yes stop_codon:yes gene_type:complete